MARGVRGQQRIKVPRIQADLLPKSPYRRHGLACFLRGWSGPQLAASAEGRPEIGMDELSASVPPAWKG